MKTLQFFSNAFRHLACWEKLVSRGFKNGGNVQSNQLVSRFTAVTFTVPVGKWLLVFRTQKRAVLQWSGWHQWLQPASLLRNPSLYPWFILSIINSKHTCRLESCKKTFENHETKKLYQEVCSKVSSHGPEPKIFTFLLRSACCGWLQPTGYNGLEGSQTGWKCVYIYIHICVYIYIYIYISGILRYILWMHDARYTVIIHVYTPVYNPLCVLYMFALYLK